MTRAQRVAQVIAWTLGLSVAARLALTVLPLPPH